MHEVYRGLEEKLKPLTRGLNKQVTRAFICGARALISHA